MTGYAVVDVETTGFSWRYGDRIVEIAVVHLDSHGFVEHQWTTLVNPRRPVAGTYVHGIRDQDVRDAPEFRDIAGVLANLLSGRVFVAHNAHFDAGFIAHEFDELGYSVPLDREHRLCTLSWSRHYLPGPPRTLDSCCRNAGISIDYAHEALSDARATAGLLRYYLDCSAGRAPWEANLWAAETGTWPRLPLTRAQTKSRAIGRALTTPPYSAPLRPGPMLGEARVHRPPSASTPTSASNLPSAPRTPEPVSLRSGERVVFTSGVSASRRDLIDVTLALGLSVSTYVTKNVSVLVATPEEVESAVAWRARQRGVPVATVVEFQALLLERYSS